MSLTRIISRETESTSLTCNRRAKSTSRFALHLSLEDFPVVPVVPVVQDVEDVEDTVDVEDVEDMEDVKNVAGSKRGTSEASFKDASRATMRLE